MNDLEIIDKYHGLTRIEDEFREMKGTLETRSIWVNTPEHIQAHLLICFMALTMMRVIQHKIMKSLTEDKLKELNWSYGLPGNRFQKALRSWTVDRISDEYYRMSNIVNDDLLTICRAVHLQIPLNLFTLGDLRKPKSSVKVF